MEDDFAPLLPKTKQRVRENRKNQTRPEAILWNAIRGRKLVGMKFRRQHPIGPFIADFCCTEEKLVLELDGNSHIGRANYDSDRQIWIEDQGYVVFRIDNDEVLRELESMLMGILKATGRDPFTGEKMSG